MRQIPGVVLAVVLVLATASAPLEGATTRLVRNLTATTLTIALGGGRNVRLKPGESTQLSTAAFEGAAVQALVRNGRLGVDPGHASEPDSPVTSGSAVIGPPRLEEAPPAPPAKPRRGHAPRRSVPLKQR